MLLWGAWNLLRSARSEVKSLEQSGTSLASAESSGVAYFSYSTGEGSVSDMEVPFLGSFRKSNDNFQDLEQRRRMLVVLYLLVFLLLFQCKGWTSTNVPVSFQSSSSLEYSHWINLGL